MQSTALLTTVAMLAALISMPLRAENRTHDHERDRQHTTDARSANGYDHGMQVVAHDAAPATPGHGWRYFADPAARRAVVISPQGDYYFSNRGKGLRWIAAEQTGV